MLDGPAESHLEIHLEAIAVPDERLKRLKKLERGGGCVCYLLSSVEWNELAGRSFTPETAAVKLPRRTIYEEKDKEGLSLSVSSGKTGFAEKLTILIGARVPGKNYPLLADALIVEGAR